MAMPKYVCTQCCYAGNHKRIGRRGSDALEKILWKCLILPGFLYSTWRNVGSAKVCPRCEKANTMISVKTPHGQRLIGA